MDPIQTCKGCGVKIRFREPDVASIFKCPKCGERYRVGPPPEVEPPPASDAKPGPEGSPPPGDGSVARTAGRVALQAGQKVAQAASAATGKFKHWFNIGGVCLELRDVDPYIRFGTGEIDGSLVLSSGAIRRIVRVECKILSQESWIVPVEEKNNPDGRRTRREERHHVLGSWHQTDPLDLSPGLPHTVTFSVPYSLEKSLKHRDDLLGTLGKLASFVNRERVSYSLVASCHVEGTLVTPSASHHLVAST